MNVQQLCHALKVKWLLYYRQNRPWLTKLRIWGTFAGKRRPSSSFILATAINLEPQLLEILPFIVSLSSNPDQVIVALGLDFNPEEEMKSLTEATPVVAANTTNGNVPIASSMVKTNANGKNGNGLSEQPILPKAQSSVSLSSPTQATNLPSWLDESCKGVGWNRHNLGE